MKIIQINRKESLLDKLYIPAIFNGLKQTVSHFFNNLFGRKKTVTIQYPETQRDIAPRWRGRHRLTRRTDGFLKCVACEMCATVCPAHCIHIEAGDNPDKSIERFPIVFDIDELRCIYCGLCVEACPKDAIRMDTGVVSLAFSARNKFDYNRNMLADDYQPNEFTKYIQLPPTQEKIADAD